MTWYLGAGLVRADEESQSGGRLARRGGCGGGHGRGGAGVVVGHQQNGALGEGQLERGRGARPCRRRRRRRLGAPLGVDERGLGEEEAALGEEALDAFGVQGGAALVRTQSLLGLRRGCFKGCRDVPYWGGGRGYIRGTGAVAGKKN